MKNKRIRVSLDVAQRGGGGFGKDTSLGIFFRGEHPETFFSDGLPGKTSGVVEASESEPSHFYPRPYNRKP